MVVAKIAAPVFELPVFLSRFQPFSLPCRIVRILERHIVQAERLTSHPGPILCCELIEEHLHRRAIRYDVMHRQYKNVLILRKPDQRQAQ